MYVYLFILLIFTYLRGYKYLNYINQSDEENTLRYIIYLFICFVTIIIKYLFFDIIIVEMQV